MENDTGTLIQRVKMFLEDGEWGKADEYCERILDADLENAKAYLGKLMAEFHIHTIDGLKDNSVPLEKSINYQRALMYGEDDLVTKLQEYNENTKNNLQKRKTQKSRRQKTILIIAIGVLAVAALVTGVLILSSYNSPESVAKRLIKANQENDSFTFISLSAYGQDLNAEEEKEILNSISIPNVEFKNRNDFTQYMRKLKEDQIREEYGDYSTELEVTNSRSISVEEVQGTIENYFSIWGAPDPNDVTEARVVTVKYLIRGENDKLGGEIDDVYLVKVNGAWKALHVSWIEYID